MIGELIYYLYVIQLFVQWLAGSQLDIGRISDLLKMARLLFLILPVSMASAENSPPPPLNQGAWLIYTCPSYQGY